MFIKHSDDVSTQVVEAGEGTTIQVLISPEEGPNFAMRKFVMQPGGGMPKHTNEIEHEQYVLRGRALVGLGDATFEARAGDVLFIPAGVPHWYRNVGDEPYEFLCIVPNLPDKIEILGE
ncbi:MAG TPA: cupin domain-containing protein [Anaerolineae bacterium]|nr:cupin domain-containing protein [Caldilineae bacterium]HID34597.1 cupin domain-containing protein [Anaerolineae bacterium]HIQ12495.1 cupin domain-containing protein [Caldilineales bacterium]